MVFAPNPSERRGIVVVLVLLIAGAGWDLYRAAEIGRQPIRLTASGRAADTVTASAETAVSDAPPVSSATPRTVDLNRASAAELDALPGIGPVLARRILEHRRLQGPFRSVVELRAVPGIGPALLRRLDGRVRVGAAAETTAAGRAERTPVGRPGELLFPSR